MTLGAAIVSAAAHAPTLAWLALAIAVWALSGVLPPLPGGSLGVLALGVIVAWMSCAAGARRAGLDYRLGDVLAAPAYWALLSLAFVHAAWRLAVEPHVWDKTPHDRDDQMPELTVVALDAGREAA